MQIPETALLEKVNLDLGNEKMAGWDDYMQPCEVNLDNDKTYFFKHKDNLYVKTAKGLYELPKDAGREHDSRYFLDKYEIAAITGWSVFHAKKKMLEFYQKHKGNMQYIRGLVPRKKFLEQFGVDS